MQNTRRTTMAATPKLRLQGVALYGDKCIDLGRRFKKFYSKLEDSFAAVSQMAKPPEDQQTLLQEILIELRHIRRDQAVIGYTQTAAQLMNTDDASSNAVATWRIANAETGSYAEEEEEDATEDANADF